MGRDHPRLTQELAVLGIDLQTTLDDEPRFLLDRAFLGSLHAELQGRLGARDARSALLQVGFLHGLRDAARVVLAGFGPTLEPAPGMPTAPRLAIQLEPPGRELQLTGCWPERREAEAHLSVQGPCPEPGCFVSCGYTSGWLSGLLETDLLAVETSCSASGAEQCRFDAREPSSWREAGEPRARAILEELPFAALRPIVDRHLAGRIHREPPGPDGFEAGSPVVHVWGPVMVVPYSGPEECLRALELIGRDPGARQVRVVILDLSGTLIDDGFGAAALEQVLAAIEGAGAEPLLAGISPISQPVVAELEGAHLVLHKDLPEAIAAAFQIADAQRRSS